MPYQGGAYTNPGWVNNQSPYINKANLDDISNALADLTESASVATPIAKGGTGATTASQARTNLGVPSLSNVTSKGSNTNPVYFNESGVAVPISTIEYQLNTDNLVGTILKYGKNVMITARTSNPVVQSDLMNVIPAAYRPAQQAYGYCFGTDTTAAGDSAEVIGLVSINTSGTVRIQGNIYPTNKGDMYYKFTLTYITA